jgi:methylated-DNA-protein-cysteine methyltransferase-like protein
MSPDRSDTWRRIYAVISRIPEGSVATYGQIARLAGFGGHARMVGYALHALPSGSDVPWHRVINAQGKISLRSDGEFALIQRGLLEREGLEFSATGRISLDRFGWKPRTTAYPV